MAFNRTFDSLLNDLLTDYANQLPGADISKGSLIFIKIAAEASALWGLYQTLDYLARQMFPDTADREHLEHYATLRGMPLISGETDAALLSRLLEFIRRPPSGGSRYDYTRWAMEITGVAAAWCVPNGQGVGTVDVVLLADPVVTGSEIPTVGLLAAVRAHLVDLCPINVKFVRCLAPELLLQDVTIVRTGATYPAASAVADITAVLDLFTPGQPLYPAQLTNLALGSEAGDAAVTVPAGGAVYPTGYQMIRPGTVNVA